MKADLVPEKMVVLVLSAFLVSLVGVSVFHIQVTAIREMEAGLSTDLPYFNLNCSSSMNGFTNTHTSVG